MDELSMHERFAMSLGTAKGLCYLHDIDIVHGDLKADNVLVSPSGQPLLADFGLSGMKQSPYSEGLYDTETSRGSTRWMAYDFYHHDQSETLRPNVKTDVWAFGMTELELLTSERPYAHIRSDERTMTEIVKGRLPPKPIIRSSDPDASLKRFMWSVCRKCWAKNPKKRPCTRDVLNEMLEYRRKHLRS